jgi:microcin C transport system ATP-binding protein
MMSVVDVRPGETLGIVGESGSGKSTLGLALLSLSVARVAGTIAFEGKQIDTMRSEAHCGQCARECRVVFQDPFASLSPRRTIEQIVGEGLALHQPQLGTDGIRKAVADSLTEVGLLPEMMIALSA